jgi:DNA polymerase-3 subunit gamma/tau
VASNGGVSGGTASSPVSPAVAAGGSPAGGGAGEHGGAPAAPAGHAAVAPANAPSDTSWSAILNQLDLQGSAKELARHCVLLGRQGALVRLALDPSVKFVRTPAQEERLTQALSRFYGEPVRIEITMGAAGVETPAQADQRASQQELEAARQSFDSDPGVQGFRDRFGATVMPNTVRQEK